MKPRRSRGFTLLEMAIGLVVMAIVATVALPSFGAAAQRARLKAAAETLASDLAEARFEAARQGRPLGVELDATPAWCWSVTSAANCGCRQKASCQLRSTQAADHAGVELADAHSARFDPTGVAMAGGGATFRTSKGDALKVDIGPTGRGRICSPNASVAAYPPC